MKTSRILFLVIALVAGGLAAFLATRGSAPVAPEVVTEIQREARTEILVATNAIGTGERLGPSVLQWQEWPAGALRPEYVTRSNSPDAIAELSGAVVRFEIFAGEPIREAKLARADSGYLSAVLAPGTRGVSIEVNTVSGAGGFINPNDRVDVVLTRQINGGRQSRTILSNVKVLAIGPRLGEMGQSGSSDGAPVDDPQSKTFANTTVATLELLPQEGEVLVNASLVGDLNLVLRSVADFAATKEQATKAQQQNAAIRLIRYGRSQSVTTGSGVLDDGGQDAPQSENSPNPPAPAPNYAPLNNGAVLGTGNNNPTGFPPDLQMQE